MCTLSVFASLSHLSHRERQGVQLIMAAHVVR